MSATAVVDVGGPGRAGPRVFTSTADPVAANDITAFHKIGDIIFNTTTGSMFTCISNASGVAVWHNTNADPITIPWNASSGAIVPGFVANRPCIVSAIIANVEVTGTDAGAVTAVVKKAPTGTAMSSGTALHTGTINLKGTAATNQSLTLAGSTALQLNAGDRIALNLTGTLTAAVGSVTILLQPQ